MANARVWGGDSEVSIDRVNQWMRSQPWYRQQLAAWGQSPSNVRLSGAQRQQLLRLAQANGVTVDEGDIEVDPAGNFNPKGHKLRNTLLGAGIGAAALTGFGAAGLGPLSSLFGGSAAAGASGTAALPAIGGGGTLAANLGTASALPTMGGSAALTSAAASGGGSAMANAVRGAAQAGAGDWIDRLAPLIGLGATAATGGFSTPQVGIDPAIRQQMADLLAMQTNRAQQAQPVYEAAMRLAGQLAPTASTSPRLQEAIRDAGTPVSSRPTLDPQVTAALSRIMNGGR